MNAEAKSRMWAGQNLSMISKAVTHFAFRNGPVEEMHANGQLSDSEMKTLNRFMVNRLAHVFTLIIEERSLELELLVRATDAVFGADWDEVQADDGGTRDLMEMMVKACKRKRGCGDGENSVWEK